MGCNIVFITNRKSHFGFQLVPKSVILNGLEWRNGCFCVILPNLVALATSHIKGVKDRSILSVTKLQSKESSYSDI